MRRLPLLASALVLAIPTASAKDAEITPEDLAALDSKAQDTAKQLVAAVVRGDADAVLALTGGPLTKFGQPLKKAALRKLVKKQGGYAALGLVPDDKWRAEEAGGEVLVYPGTREGLRAVAVLERDAEEWRLAEVRREYFPKAEVEVETTAGALAYGAAGSWQTSGGTDLDIAGAAEDSVALVLAIDRSGSMRERREAVAELVRGLGKSLESGDAVSIVTFGDDAVAYPFHEPDDPDLVVEAAAGVPRGGADLMPALAAARARLDETWAKERRRQLVVLLDGPTVDADLHETIAGYLERGDRVTFLTFDDAELNGDDLVAPEALDERWHAQVVRLPSIDDASAEIADIVARRRAE